jgi:hypothetical protein
MPKPSWVTLFLKILGFAGRVATDANQAFPNAGHRVPAREQRPLKAASLPVNDPNGNVVKLGTAVKFARTLRDIGADPKVIAIADAKVAEAKKRRRKVGKDVTRLDEQ